MKSPTQGYADRKADALGPPRIDATDCRDEWEVAATELTESQRVWVDKMHAQFMEAYWQSLINANNVIKR